MKGWLLGALVLILLYGLPFTKHDTGKLLPILCLQAQREGDRIHILSEAGEGYGKTWQEAVTDLRANASGEVFFDTAEQAVFSDPRLAVEAARSGELRPGAGVFLRQGLEDPRELYAFYSQHGSDVKISDIMGVGNDHGKGEE
jgi:hypothetical protein